MDEHLLSMVEGLLRTKKRQALARLLPTIDSATLALLLERLTRGRRKVFGLLPPELQADTAVRLSPHIQEHLLPQLPDTDTARFLHFLSEDDATDLLQFLSTPHRANVLKLMKPEKRKKLEKLLTFGAETAGGIMDLNFVTVDADMTAREVLGRLHAHTSRRGNAPMPIVIDSGGHVVGYLPHRTLLFAPATKAAADLALNVPTTHSSTDREHVLELLSRTKSSVVCVMDDGGNPIGIINISDLLAVARAEATEDVFRFAGVDREESVHDGVLVKVGRRSSWLIVNLGTAFLASGVVALFQDTIARLAILAVFMPMVAGQGGNAATQALAVVVRGLAMGEIPWRQARRIIVRESIAGMLNGVIIGLVAGGAALLFHAPPILGLVLGVAMVINLFIAGLFGALIPFVLKWLRIDPAVASSIFVTTATDVFGFLAFLGLGSLWM